MYLLFEVVTKSIILLMPLLCSYLQQRALKDPSFSYEVLPVSFIPVVSVYNPILIAFSWNFVLDPSLLS